MALSTRTLEPLNYYSPSHFSPTPAWWFIWMAHQLDIVIPIWNHCSVMMIYQSSVTSSHYFCLQAKGCIWPDREVMIPYDRIGRTVLSSRFSSRMFQPFHMEVLTVTEVSWGQQTWYYRQGKLLQDQDKARFSYKPRVYRVKSYCLPLMEINLRIGCVTCWLSSKFRHRWEWI